jgi:hypothetical protein
VVAHQKLKRNLTRRLYAGRFGGKHPTVSRDGGASAHKLGQTLALNETNAASTVTLYAFVVAKGGYLNAARTGKVKDGATLFSDAFNAVYSNFYHIHFNTPPKSLYFDRAKAANALALSALYALVRVDAVGLFDLA